MIKRTLLAAAIFSALPAYAGLTSITAGYDFYRLFWRSWQP